MKQLNLVKLVVTVFVISWVGILPSLLKAHNFNIPNYLLFLKPLMYFGPLLVTLFFVYKSDKKTGIKNLFKKLLIVKVKPLLLLFILLSPFIISFFGAFLGFSFSEENWPEIFNLNSILSRFFSTFIIYLILNTEEYVWRAVVFEKLLEKFSFNKSCLILAPIWWLFHTPYFLFPNGHEANYGILEFTFMVIPLTVIIGWIYVKTNRSLFYAHIYHQLMNATGEAFPIFPVFIAGNLLPVRFFCFLLTLLALTLLFFKPIKNITTT